jgi:crotonobetainyl-CoA:carnitine CoA-transferase CaiB-like acyl-CoA transferase
MPTRDSAWAIYEPFDTADGEQIFIGLTSDQQWGRFCQHFARRDLLDDPAYRSNQDRVRERPALRPVVADIVGRHTLAQLTELFDRLDIPFSPVAKPGDLFDDPQLNGRGRMLDVTFQNGVHARMPRLPVEIGEHDLGLRRQPPAIGEHTAEVLAELGLAPSEIEDLSARGIIALSARDKQ